MTYMHVSIIVALCASLVYVSYQKDREEDLTCPLRLEHGRYVINPDKLAAFPYVASELQLGVHLFLRPLPDRPDQYGIYNGSSLLAYIAAGSVVLGDRRVDDLKPNRLYVTGMHLPATDDDLDYVDELSEITLQTQYGSQYSFREVRLKTDGATGLRIVSVDAPDNMVTAIMHRRVPQFVFGLVPPSIVFSNPSETFFTPFGAVSQQVTRFVTPAYVTGSTYITITHTPVPSSCVLRRSVDMRQIRLRLSPDGDPATMCVPLAAVFAAVTPLQPWNYTSVDTVPVCFMPGTCDQPIAYLNQTVVRATVQAQGVYVALGCTMDRMDIVCTI
jgi:hypothetical protein